MKNLAIDIETYSSVHIGKSGVYPYAQADDFEILLFAYSVDRGPVQIVDLAQGEELPAEILDALTDETVIKSAFNAQFERVCIGEFFGLDLDVKQWRCDMIHAAYLGLPLSLASAASALKLDVEKDTRGKALIRFFCGPVKATKANGGRERNLPEHDLEKWQEFKEYCIRDVEVEVAIQKKLDAFPVPDSEWENYFVDQTINDRGICIDTAFAARAVECDSQLRDKRMERAREITGLDNPNSPMQVQAWLTENGCPMDSLRKADVTEAVKTATGAAKEVLELRQELSRSSIKKYEAMANATAVDGRAHGLIQFYGANRTGRYAGRLIQVQNLPRNYLPDLELARELVKSGDFETLELLFDSVPDTLSQLIRTAFIPSPGNRFLVADYSAIEARVIAWLAGEKWRLELFEQGGDIYCQSASAMFGVPVEKHGVNGELRQKGKIAELACGYGGSTGALEAMGALSMGLKPEELPPLVDAWRTANPHIVKWWKDLENAAQFTVTTKRTRRLRNIEFSMDKGVLFIQLPSGRKLAYPHATMGVNRFDGPAINFRGVGTNKRWSTQETYGGKLAENITQAVARDILAEAMRQLEKYGYPIVMHVHDEVVIDATPDMSLDAVCELMTANPDWAEGLPLDADGYECNFYQKD